MVDAFGGFYITSVILKKIGLYLYVVGFFSKMELWAI